MAVKKVILNGDTIIDLSDTTATEDKVAAGYKFYKANGDAAYGQMENSGNNGSVNGYSIQNVTNRGTIIRVDGYELPMSEGQDVDSWLISDILNKIQTNGGKPLQFQETFTSDYIGIAYQGNLINTCTTNRDYQTFGFFKEGLNEGIRPIVNSVKIYSGENEVQVPTEEKRYTVSIVPNQDATEAYVAQCKTLITYENLTEEEKAAFNQFATAVDIVFYEIVKGKE